MIVREEEGGEMRTCVGTTEMVGEVDEGIRLHF